MSQFKGSLWLKLTHIINIYSIHEFWKFYGKLPDIKRVHYEVIKSNEPCRLYFDLGMNIVKGYILMSDATFAVAPWPTRRTW